MQAELSHPRDRILSASFEVFQRCGVQSGTMADVARQAGIGRATLYRYFPGKESLISALVLREERRLFALLDEELRTDDNPQSMLERGLLTALSHLRSHSLLQRILREEPESILPFLTVRAAPVMEAAVDFITPYIERAVKAERIAPIDPRAAAEWAARILLSLLLTPSVVVDLDESEQVAAFVSWLTRGVELQGALA